MKSLALFMVEMDLLRKALPWYAILKWFQGLVLVQMEAKFCLVGDSESLFMLDKTVVLLLCV